MARFIQDLDLLGTAGGIRKIIRPGVRPTVPPVQAFALRDVDSTAKAVNRLTLKAMMLLEALPPADIASDHPAIGVLSTILHHPQVDRKYFKLLPESHLTSVERALEERSLDWDPGQLEWQIVQAIDILGQNVAIDQRLSLPEQRFDSSALQEAWDMLWELAVLRGMGFV